MIIVKNNLSSTLRVALSKRDFLILWEDEWKRTDWIWRTYRLGFWKQIGSICLELFCCHIHLTKRRKQDLLISRNRATCECHLYHDAEEKSVRTFKMPISTAHNSLNGKTNGHSVDDVVTESLEMAREKGGKLPRVASAFGLYMKDDLSKARFCTLIFSMTEKIGALSEALKIFSVWDTTSHAW